MYKKSRRCRFTRDLASRRADVPDYGCASELCAPCRRAVSAGCPTVQHVCRLGR